jgi:hypothetical protein
MVEAEDQPLVQIPHMPHRLDQRVLVEVVDQLCSVMTSHGVVPTPIKGILQEGDISRIHRIFPRDMTFLMHHIVGAINLIETLRCDTHDPTPSIS